MRKHSLLTIVLLISGTPWAFAQSVRVATFNIRELSWEKLQQVDSQGRGNNAQLQAAAEILQRIRPDIVLINEIDYTGPVDADGDIPANRNAAKSFHDRYLAVSQNGQSPLSLEHLFYRATNTGMPSGLDFNNNGKTDDPNDAFGFGRYPGQYGQALFSRFPIDMTRARTFRKLLWKDVPQDLMPDGTEGKPSFYTPQAIAVFRLSSKSHWDVPITVAGHTIHFLCSHPTPPVFDGPEDSNGRRNFDEVRLWQDYIAGDDTARWIRDDGGEIGGLSPEQRFIILGDLNAEPLRGDATYGMRPIDMLLRHPRVQDPQPKSRGATSEPFALEFESVRPLRTSDFGRLDYVLPCRELKIKGTGVHWPESSEPGHDTAQLASDHRLVWVDLETK